MRGKRRQGRARRAADTPEILAVIIDVSMGFLAAFTRQWPIFFPLTPRSRYGDPPRALALHARFHWQSKRDTTISREQPVNTFCRRNEHGRTR